MVWLSWLRQEIQLRLARAIEELSKQPEKLADLAGRVRVFTDANLGSEVGRKKYLDWVEKLNGSK